MSDTSSIVVTGLTKQKRSTVSPPHVVGTRRPSRRRAPRRSTPGSRPAAQPTRRNSTTLSSGSTSNSTWGVVDQPAPSRASPSEASTAVAVGARCRGSPARTRTAGRAPGGRGGGRSRSGSTPESRTGSPNRAVQHVQVLGVLPVGGRADRRVAIDERAAVERREQPLVRVDDEAVGTLDPGVPVPDARAASAGASVGTVDVEPVPSSALRRRRPRRGRRSRRRSSSRSSPRRRRPRSRSTASSAATVGADGAARSRPSLIGGHELHVDIHHPGRLGDGRVGAGGGDHQPTGAVVRALGPRAPVVAGGDERARGCRSCRR